MNKTSSIPALEARSLVIGKWANLFMAFSGVLASWLSHSDALLVDGLYSSVNFLSAIVATRIGRSVVRLPDQQRPFGYYADEALYITFRSIILVGILFFAGFSALIKIATYAAGGQVPELVFGPILIYVVLMVVICLGLAFLHHKNWLKTGKRSGLLRTESRAAVIDGVVSAGAGIGLLILPLLKGTSLNIIIPVADAIVVLLLIGFIIKQPIAMFLKALREIAGAGSPAEVLARIEAQIKPLLSRSDCRIINIAATQLGRMHFIMIYLNLDRAIKAVEIDTLNMKIQAILDKTLGSVKVEIVVTEKPRYAP